MTTNKQRQAAAKTAAAAEEAQSTAQAAQEAAEVVQEAVAEADEISAEKEQSEGDGEAAKSPEMLPAPNGRADDAEGSSLPEQFEAGRLYDVQLLKPIVIGNRTLPPGDAQTITAELCQANRDKLWRASLNDSGVQEA